MTARWMLPALAFCMWPGPVHSQLNERATAPAAVLPDWGGIWFVEGGEPGISGLPQGVGISAEGLPAIPLLVSFASASLTAKGRALWETKVATLTNAKAEGWGYPLMMSGAAPLQFVVTPDETLIVNMYRDIRHIYTDGRGLPAMEDSWPTVWGESVGHWEGDTLVIETVSVREPDQYFALSLPLTAQARYTERLRKVAPDRIESEMTIEDPAILDAPMTGRLAYVRAAGIDRLVHDVFVNDRSVPEGDTFAIAPPSDGL